MNFKTKKRIKYWFTARHRKGHGIHSPFLFRLISEIIENKTDLDSYSIINQIYKQDKKRKTEKHIKFSLRFSKLLFRLVNDFSPQTINYYGVVPESGLFALALATKQNRLKCFFDEKEFIEIGTKKATIFGINNIIFDEYQNRTTSDFTVINFPNNFLKSSEIINNQLINCKSNHIVIIRGIHHSIEMEKLWNDYSSNPKVRISLDLFEVGIAIFNQKLQKESFVLRF